MTNKSLIVLLVGIHFLIASFDHTILGKNADTMREPKYKWKQLIETQLVGKKVTNKTIHFSKETKRWNAFFVPLTLEVYCWLSDWRGDSKNRSF